MGTLYTLIIGFVGGVFGALVTDFLHKPFQQFRALRTEIRQEMLRLANVSAPDPNWYNWDEATRDRLLAPSREAKTTFRELGSRQAVPQPLRPWLLTRNLSVRVPPRLCRK